jgi:L-lactate dehydrogenase complex protein LldG
VAVFAERARAVSAAVEIVASMDELVAHATAWCTTRAVRRAIMWEDPDLAPMADRLRISGIEIVPAGAGVGAVAEVDAGITGADWGIAETGTLVLGCGPGRPRLASLLPPAHIAVLRASRILPDLPALFARVGPLPSALTLVTGPSRSADIGLVPVFGAHGPMAVAILILAD